MTLDVPIFQHEDVEFLIEILKHEMPHSITLLNLLKSPKGENDSIVASFDHQVKEKDKLPLPFMIAIINKGEDPKVSLYSSIQSSSLLDRPSDLSLLQVRSQLEGLINFISEDGVEQYDSMPSVVKQNLNSEFYEHNKAYNRDLDPFTSETAYPLLFACIDSRILQILENIPVGLRYRVPYDKYLLQLSQLKDLKLRTLDSRYNFEFGSVESRYFELVIQTASIKRNKKYYEQLTSSGLYSHENGIRNLVAWVFLGFDGSLVSLYVMEGFRRCGLAKHVIQQLAINITTLPTNESDYIHADVARSNEQSSGLISSLGGKIISENRWLFLGIDFKGPAHEP